MFPRVSHVLLQNIKDLFGNRMLPRRAQHQRPNPQPLLRDARVVLTIRVMVHVPISHISSAALAQRNFLQSICESKVTVKNDL